MDDDYTPTTFEVLEAWADSRWDQYGERKWSDHAAEFDRWVAKVKAEALREAAEDFTSPATIGAHLTPESRRWLIIHADRIEQDAVP